MSTDNSSRIKWICWPSEVEDMIDKYEFHTSFHLGTDMINQVNIDEPIQLVIMDEGQPIHKGLAEVVSMKITNIANLTKEDIYRQAEGFSSRKEVLSSLRRKNPDELLDYRSLLTVVTLRRFDYDLSKLPPIKETTKNAVGQKPRKMRRLRWNKS